MEKITLNGEWVLSGGEFAQVKANVPGCVHTDLLHEKLIDDPYYRDNESKLMYLGELDWVYERTFFVSADMMACNKIDLICHGLDTLATVSINDHTVAKTNNMFRKWIFDIHDCINEGQNTIRIKCQSTYPYMKEKLEERYLAITGANHHRILGSNYVRKMQCNYGWDWGPMCVTAGIWKDIEVVGYHHAKLDHVQTKQSHDEHMVELQVITHLAGNIEPNKLFLDITLEHEGKHVASKVYPVKDSSTAVPITIENPALWWPNNLGKQNLYTLSVHLLDNNNQLMDNKQFRIGLRTLVLDIHKDQYGESFQFVVNGIPFFAKGGNWIPIDTFVTRGSDAFYRQQLTDVKNANMNFIRVWGGGIYESDVFYDLCDELGLCVWQDFAFACSAYPVYDKDFLDTFKQEAIDNIKRIRHHASLALWCGNNEIEYMGNMVSDALEEGKMTWDEYKLLFDELIPSLITTYDNEHSYWASSPMDDSHDRKDPNDATKGDAHLWDVWHGREPFEWYRTCHHRFNSEFGFQSFPEPNVVKSYTKKEDRNITSYVMEKHQRSVIGNETIILYMLSWFKLPTSFDMLLWTSQILQSLAIKYAVENWRRKMPEGMGTLYWQINDCWPVASWSSIDAMGNLKALHYSAKKFYNPVLISGIEDKDNLSVEIHLTNDTLEKQSGVIQWTLFHVNGCVLKEGTMEASIEANTASAVTTLNLYEAIEHAGGVRHVVLHYAFAVHDQVLSENTTYFVYPKHLELEKPDFKVGITKVTNQQYQVTVSSNKPCLWVWMELGHITARYSDRFFDLFNGQTKEVTIHMNEGLELHAFRSQLVIHSIVDTYQS
ncbi:glycoside hydrolase family 2 protein [Vallitalea pronyensis]|uniref:Beta-mannosidase B n=1 Tax=Vallitalea pronyensis TaxID=1348613 RepID=A0A8J8MNH7_9FIRM|nr:glycoside hydrolase family 2 protein [Vallitalea pronyensis]QUI24811.1 glycoside hydrolase family 2 protein [Vallitalea pronyensis]